MNGLRKDISNSGSGLNDPEDDLDNSESGSDCPDDVYITTSMIDTVVDKNYWKMKRQKWRFNVNSASLTRIKVSLFLLLTQTLNDQFMTNSFSDKMSVPMLKENRPLFATEIAAPFTSCNSSCIHVYAVPFPFVRLRCEQSQITSNSTTNLPRITNLPHTTNLPRTTNLPCTTNLPRQLRHVFDGLQRSTWVESATTMQMRIRRREAPGVAESSRIQRRQHPEGRGRTSSMRRQSSRTERQSAVTNTAIRASRGRMYPEIMAYHTEEVDGRHVVRVDFNTDYLRYSHRYDAIRVSHDAPVSERQSSIRRRQSHVRDRLSSGKKQQHNSGRHLQHSNTAQQPFRRGNNSPERQTRIRVEHLSTERTITTQNVYSPTHQIEERCRRGENRGNFLTNSTRFETRTHGSSRDGRRSFIRRHPSHPRDGATRQTGIYSAAQEVLTNRQSNTRRNVLCSGNDTNGYHDIQSSASNYQSFWGYNERRYMGTRLQPSTSVIVEGSSHLMYRSTFRNQSSERRQLPMERTINPQRIYPQAMFYHIEERDGERVIRVDYPDDFLTTFHRYDIIYVSQHQEQGMEPEKTEEDSI
ncbi:uncharacterized protein [Argopecten irradians]|uniref:uncharacterized protein n=1 Tax=Argopecten irradians TaxID=31199 RepID=UPI003723743E